MLKSQFQELIYGFDSHFLEKLQTDGYKGVKRWDKDINIFEKQFIFYPMFENMHWFLAVQNNETRTLTLLDPYIHLNTVVHPPKQRKFAPLLRKLRSSNLNLTVKKHFERISLVHTEYVLKHENLPPGFNLELIVTHSPEIPHQSNGYDCGVFLLEFMKYITFKKPFNFSCSDMTYFRQEIRTEFERKVIGNTLETPLLQARTQTLP